MEDSTAKALIADYLLHCKIYRLSTRIPKPQHMTSLLFVSGHYSNIQHEIDTDATR